MDWHAELLSYGAMAGSRRNVPVTIVSGFKGAGKSTLVEHVVKSARGQRVAVIHDDGEKDLFAEIDNALSVQACDVIVVECAANLEPYFVAEHLVYGDDETPPPTGIRVDTLVTVVDSSSWLDEIQLSADLLERELAFDEEDDRMVSELLLEQIEFSDVIVLNKTDKVSTEDSDAQEALLVRLNPRARVFRCERGRVPVADLLDTGAFDILETDDGAGWLAELSGEFRSGMGGFDVSSFTFVEHRPFHPIRFNELLNEFDVHGLIRAKGSVWVASRHHEIGIWSLAGRASLLTYGGAWFAATPAREWPADERERAEIMKGWVPPFGDRRQEIAFIGLKLNENEIRERLRESLLTPDEMKDGPEGWFSIPDPLPDWHTDTDPESYGGTWS
ncbi:MAG: GTP-binding protein [Bdellovibrionota bacterium]